MRTSTRSPSLPILATALFGLLATRVSADDILETNGFSSCLQNSSIQVTAMNLKFDRSTNVVNFDLAGTSTEVQNVTAFLEIAAYGVQAYNNTFDPCGNNPHVPQLCPVPQGTFSAQGQWAIPQSISSQIPSIVYSIPDLDGTSKIELKSNSGSNNGTDVACYEASVTNTKTTKLPAVSWAVAGIAGAALIVSGVGAIAAAVGGHPGAAQSSPTFTEVILYFQGVATNGMISVDYPAVYRDFTQNFAFAAGLVPFGNMESTIDNFRSATGGNLTDNSYEYLQNSTLIYQDPSQTGLTKRGLLSSALEGATLFVRDGISTNVNGSSNSIGGNSTSNSTAPAPSKNQVYVQGIEAYANSLLVPNDNIFMTALLIFAIILAAIAASILLFKVILEGWALLASFPKKLVGFRKNYWWLMAKTITNVILLLYGVWVLYCVYQFRQGDSWAAQVLAGVTLGIFTAVLIGFTARIWWMAHKYKSTKGDASILYENKDVWRKYSIFYDNYKRSYWWLFIPVIVYMFAKGVVLAGADGKTSNHSLAQTAALLILDSLMLLGLIFLRPYQLKSGNWINITIQAVRVISVVCILIFVEQLGFSQTTKTVTGVVLIVVQASLSGVLGILIAINALVNCIRMNPHRKARKDAQRTKDLDALTPLDAHNSLLMYPVDSKDPSLTKTESLGTHSRGRSQQGYDMLPLRDESSDRLLSSHSHDRLPSMTREPALPNIGGFHDRNMSSTSLSSMHRQPQLPDLEYRGAPGTAL